MGELGIGPIPSLSELTLSKHNATDMKLCTSTYIFANISSFWNVIHIFSLTSVVFETSSITTLNWSKLITLSALRQIIFELKKVFKLLFHQALVQTWLLSTFFQYSVHGCIICQKVLSIVIEKKKNKKKKHYLNDDIYSDYDVKNY